MNHNKNREQRGFDWNHMPYHRKWQSGVCTHSFSGNTGGAVSPTKKEMQKALEARNRINKVRKKAAKAAPTRK